MFRIRRAAQSEDWRGKTWTCGLKKPRGSERSSGPIGKTRKRRSGDHRSQVSRL